LLIDFPFDFPLKPSPKMAQVTQRYNTLPTLGDADNAFVDRDLKFKVLAELLAGYGNIFGLTLFHSHCKLNEGEIMLEKGNVSQPEKKETVDSYPNRWLSNGEAYEFTTEKTQSPRKELINKFHALTKDFKDDQLLGIYAIQGTRMDPAAIEWTDGCQNLTRVFKEGDTMTDFVQTAWYFARGGPVTMACTVWCDTRNTRDGSVHKGTTQNSLQSQAID
jgi:hypothetical protein